MCVNAMPLSACAKFATHRKYYYALSDAFMCNGRTNSSKLGCVIVNLRPKTLVLRISKDIEAGHDAFSITIWYS